MRKLHFIGLDVHKDSISIAVAAEGREEARVLATVPNEVRALIKQLRRLGKPDSLLCCYEAGPTGYGLQRALTDRGYECQVIAPSLIPKKVGVRIKTDRRDACSLAHFLRSGDLTPIFVPDEATEAMRDLERARDDAKRDERTARHRLGKFLLRHDRRYTTGKTRWTAKHQDWIRSLKFEHPAQQEVLHDYLHAVEESGRRIVRLTDAIGEHVQSWALAPLVTALQALRGVRLITAVAIAAEIGDFARFKKASQFMAYLGLVPSESTTGNSVRRGRITKTGNAHVRRLLVESAWAYRFQPKMSREIRKRNELVSPDVRTVAWQAQHRLHKRYRRLLARGKKHQVVVTALARELAGFVWSIARQQELLAT